MLASGFRNPTRSALLRGDLAGINLPGCEHPGYVRYDGVPRRQRMAYVYRHLFRTQMTDDVSTLIALTFLGLAVPGVLLVVLAKARFARFRGDPRRADDRLASVVGWLIVVFALAFLLLMNFVTGAPSGSGGLGSQGNPLAALVLLACGYIIAPMAWLVLIGFAVAAILRRWRR
jgi:hypothetical protein